MPAGFVRVKRQIDALVLDYCDQAIACAADIDPAYERLWRAIRDCSTAGGKRLRPYLAVQAYEGLGGTDTNMIMQAGLAWELLHVSLLVHDDIIDRDYRRHGELNVAGQLQEVYCRLGLSAADAEHYARSGALLAGDLLMAASHDCMGKLTVDERTKAKLSIVFSDAVFAVAAGELLDTEAIMHSVHATDPHKVASLKTASYSIVGPLLCGALLAGVDEATVDQLRTFGERVGIGYQLQDDLLGVFGNESLTGKSNTGDLAEGKRTILLKEAYNRVTSAERARIDQLLALPLRKADEVAELRSLIISSGAKAAAEAVIADYKAQAQRLLDVLPVRSQNKQELQWLVDFALGRSA